MLLICLKHAISISVVIQLLGIRQNLTSIVVWTDTENHFDAEKESN